MKIVWLDRLCLISNEFKNPVIIKKMTGFFYFGVLYRRGSGADCKSAIIMIRVVRLHHIPPMLGSNIG